MNGNGPVSAFVNRNPAALVQTALGRSAGDLAIVGADVLNVYTGEVLKNQSVVVAGQWIAYVGEEASNMIDAQTHVIDAAGRVLIPGLIEGHTHLSWFYTVSEFLKYAAPGGTTTVISETLESYPVCGYNGVVDFLDSLKDQPIKFFGTAPANISISSATRGNFRRDLDRLLTREDVLGLGEAYWQGVFQDPKRMLPAMQAVLAAGKTLEGHSAGARGGKLAAFSGLGVSSCHEPVTASEALERLRFGMYVMAREGSIRRDLTAIADILHEKVDLRRMILVTDGVAPRSLMEEGYLERVVQRAIELGFDAVSAIRMTTLNVAEHFSIDYMVGAISPGKYADILVLPNLETIRPEVVVSNGRIIAENGRLTIEPRVHTYSPNSLDSVHLPRPLSPEDFTIRVPDSATQMDVTVIRMITELLTREEVRTLAVRNGCIHCQSESGLNKVAAIDRTHNPGKIFTGLIRGFDLTSGAMACSAAWDTSDIIVVGACETDMAACVNRICDLKGGAVVCRQGEILAEVAFPIFGVISDLPMPELADAVDRFNQAAVSLGTRISFPLLSLNTLTTAAIPYLRICDEGLVDLKTGRKRPLLGT